MGTQAIHMMQIQTAGQGFIRYKLNIVLSGSQHGKISKNENDTSNLHVKMKDKIKKTLKSL